MRELACSTNLLVRAWMAVPVASLASAAAWAFTIASFLRSALQCPTCLGCLLKTRTSLPFFGTLWRDSSSGVEQFSQRIITSHVLPVDLATAVNQ